MFWEPAMLIVDQNNKNTAMYLIHSLKVLCLMNNAMRTYYDLGTNLCLEEPINLVSFIPYLPSQNSKS